MKCYFCQKVITPKEKSYPAGGGKEIHVECVEPYRQYLRGVVETMNRESKKGEVQ